jgi:hypothetical protein
MVFYRVSRADLSKTARRLLDAADHPWDVATVDGGFNVTPELWQAAMGDPSPEAVTADAEPVEVEVEPAEPEPASAEPATAEPPVSDPKPEPTKAEIRTWLRDAGHKVAAKGSISDSLLAIYYKAHGA